MAEIKIFEVQVNGVTKSIKNQNDLNRVIEETDQLIKKTDFGTNAFNNLTKAQARLLGEQRKLRRSQAEQAKQFGRTSEEIRKQEERTKKLEETQRQKEIRDQQRQAKLIEREKAKQVLYRAAKPLL